MRDRTISFSHARFWLLLLCFAAGAAAGFFLQDSLPHTRIFCMPRESGVSLTALAAELALWLAASLTVCAVPLLAGLILRRGGCFGLTLALLTDPANPLTAADALSPAVYVLVTLVMLYCAAGKLSPARTLLRFLPCAGMAFGIVLGIG